MNSIDQQKLTEFEHPNSNSSIHLPPTPIPIDKMQYSMVILALAAAVLAYPNGNPPSCGGDGGDGGDTPVPICTGALYTQAQCCATDVVGAVGLNCAVRKCLQSSTLLRVTDEHL